MRRRMRRQRSDLDRALRRANVVLGEERVGTWRQRVLIGLGAPCLLAPFAWELVSRLTLPTDEIAAIFVACVCAASAIHEAALTLCLSVAVWAAGGGDEDALGDEEEEEEEDDEEEEPVLEVEPVGEPEAAIAVPPPTAEELAAAAAREAAAKEATLEGRFVQRRSDMQMEARLKLRGKGATQRAGAQPARGGEGGRASEEAYFA